MIFMSLFLSACHSTAQLVQEEGLPPTKSLQQLPELKVDQQQIHLVGQPPMERKMPQTTSDLVLTVEPSLITQETKRLVFNITNESSASVQLNFSSGMLADLWLLSPEGKRLWSWSQEMMFMQMQQQKTIVPNQKLTQIFQVPETVLSQINGQGYQWQFKLMARSSQGQDYSIIEDISYQ